MIIILLVCSCIVICGLFWIAGYIHGKKSAKEEIIEFQEGKLPLLPHEWLNNIPMSPQMSLHDIIDAQIEGKVKKWRDKQQSSKDGHNGC